MLCSKRLLIVIKQAKEEIIEMSSSNSVTDSSLVLTAFWTTDINWLTTDIKLICKESKFSKQTQQPLSIKPVKILPEFKKELKILKNLNKFVTD